MPITLKIDNYASPNIKNTGKLMAAAAVGASALTVENTSGFAVNDFIVAGGIGTTGSEKLTVQSLASATSLALVSNTTLQHYQYDALTSIVGDQINIYRANNVNNYQPADSAFSKLNTINIQIDQLFTYFNDASTGDYWYKYTYFNSLSSVETDIASSLAIRNLQSVYASIDMIRAQAGLDNNPWITDSMIAEERRKSQAEIDSKLYTQYNVPFAAPIPAFIEDITIRLAAGRLLTKDYGTSATGSSKDGDLMLKDAREDLLDVDEREMILLDAASNSLLADESAGGVSSWPNNSTQIFTENGGSNYGGNFDSQQQPAPGYDYGHIVSMNSRF